jgi:transcription initiation factor IIE alpha subunit
MKRAAYSLDRYVIDTLMPDLVGHDHRPSAFLVYLTIVAATGPKGRAALSYAELAERTGLSKRTTQQAIVALQKRGLMDVSKRSPTDTPCYSPLAPWRR